MPGFSFPPVGPLGLGSPPSRPSPSGRRYYDPLRLPLHLLGSLRFALDPRYLACTRSFVSLSARRRARCRPSRRLAAFVFRLALPGLRRKELAALSSSQTTPVRTCPARGLRWCPLDSPWRLQDSCLPAQPYRRLSPHRAGLSLLLDHNYEIFAAQSRGLHTRYTWLRTHPFGYARRFTTDSAAHLLWRDLYGKPYSPTEYHQPISRRPCRFHGSGGAIRSEGNHAALSESQ